MATLKQRLHRKNSAGSYDVVHLETSASCVLLSSGDSVESKISSMETTISGKASSSHNHAASNITSGILGTARGGTGITSNPSMLVNLGSTAAASVFATSPRPGVTGVLPATLGGTGKTSLNDLKSALGITANDPASGGSGGTSGSTTAGGTMTFDNMTWTVVDNGTYNSNERVLILTDIYHLMNGYNIERFCTYFWEYVLSAEARAKCIPHCMKEFGANAHTLPVFVPTYTEVNGGFSYFNSNANRIAKYNGTAKEWWTSTPSSIDIVYCVYTDGALSNGSPGTTYGFRPCVALKI